MAEELLSAREAARRLGIAVATLYDWLGRSDRGLLVLRGRPVTVGYLQGGPRGQGRIRVEAGEVERLRDLLDGATRPAVPVARQQAVRERVPAAVAGVPAAHRVAVPAQLPAQPGHAPGPGDLQPGLAQAVAEQRQGRPGRGLRHQPAR